MKHRAKINMDFVYVPASRTNVAKTIAREKRRLAEAAKTNVVNIVRRKAK